METTPKSRRRSSRRTLLSSGWNAINHVAASSTLPPRSATQSSESPFCCQTPKPQIPILSPSEGSRRTGEWLESMAKRRKAAQETVKRTSESLEPTSDVNASNKRTRRSMVPGIAHSETTPAMAEMRVVPNVVTRSNQTLTMPNGNIQTRPRQALQVVIASTNLADARVPVISKPELEAPLTISPMSRRTCRSSLARSDFSDESESCPTTVDDLPQDEGEVYDVERVLGEKIGPGIHEFLIQWTGYDEQSWVPAEDCFCDELVTAFRAVPRTKTIEMAWIEQETVVARPTRRDTGAKSKTKVSSKTLPPPVRRIRDLITGRLQRLPTPALPPHSASDADREETPALPRYARANTARFSTRPPTPVRVHTHQDQATRDIMWQRSKAMSEVQIISWTVTPAVKERRENGRPKMSQVVGAGQNIKLEESDGDNTREVELQKTDALAAIIPQEAVPTGREQDHLTSKRQQEHIDRQKPRDMSLRKYNNNQSSLHQVASWNHLVPVHIRFDENDVPIQQARPQTPFAPRLISRPEVFCDDVLRRARTEEKKSAGPSLLRHEFSSSMSYKHAEALINNTRASPERAFGFSLPSNTVLLSIERDEY
ncbi:uncharacterized protein PAC_19759 [Phialocephala subalpina]|uniref:Chromo domain-containing protein n=1 Tax=Phialocephala subalpina TaxID=576137 RepID=A0A1L7XXY4_9HELO|nr:uncharacterized protein PAC_19759 [Phialocephala subalpina]